MPPLPPPPATRHSIGGMVCSADHLASNAGVEALCAGGNAVDAAVAAGAVLAVTTQHMCGMGGDLFALVHHADGSPPTCLNASGRAGSGADPEALRSEGHRSIPGEGDIRAVTVPGCVDGWLALHARHGRLRLSEVLEPARRSASDGFPAAPLLAAAIDRIGGVEGADDYLSRAPVRAGTVITRPGVARTLGDIGAHGRDAFYGGDFGDGLMRLGRGWFTRDDLARSQATWVEPLGLDVWGHRVWTVPPNSQGYLVLAAARLAELVGLAPGDAPAPASPEWAHALVEASRLAGHDRPHVLHESAVGDVLLAEDRLATLARRFDPDRRAELPVTATPGGTTYLCAADGDGMAVSLIQSNARGWGALVVEPTTGVFLQNRGMAFSLEPGHPAELAPGRRPPHTLAPALVQRRDGTLRAVLGTMGGDSQPQVVLQMLARLLLHGEAPDVIVTAPRWRLGGTGFDTWASDGRDEVIVEETSPDAWAPGLADRGHRVTTGAAWSSDFGHAQLLERSPDGVLSGAHDPRALSGGTATS